MTNYFFRCFDDGELMMCDYKYCPKVYHLACLGRDKMPREKWFCPWHHCVVCGKKSVYHCIHCPNGYCEAHNTLKEHDELGLICDEHRDDIADLIKFYRRVGGITYLTKDPNYPNEARVKMLSKLGKENSEPVYSEDDMPLKIVARKKEKLSSGNKRKTLAEKYSSRPSSNAAGGIKAKYKNRPFGQANPFQVGTSKTSIKTPKSKPKPKIRVQLKNPKKSQERKSRKTIQETKEKNQEKRRKS